ncbi:MAG TPA: hypothetical protein VK601_25530, partial [Kofleriaceae bacterium]|nr:hypothetical protein [Kofleriaceae bacterium]
EPGVRRALPECARIAEQRSAALAAIPRVAEPPRALQRRPQRGAIARMAIGALRGITALAVIVLASYLSAMIRRC